MEINRLWNTCCLALQRGGARRANYCRKNNLFHKVGDNCSFQFRKIPLYSRLISIHNNVHIASRVNFVTHDVTHRMLNANSDLTNKVAKEAVGCIEIMDNVFIGAGTTILYNVRIGSNVIVGGESVVTKDLEPNSVYAGVPARRIGSIEDYIINRQKVIDYPAEFAPRKQKISIELENYMWEIFMDKKG